MSDAPADHSGVVVPPPVIFLAGVGVGWLLLQRLLPPYRFPPFFVRVVGPALASAGVALIVWALLAFRRRGTNVDPRRPTTAIVTDGPYRFTRNPIYLSLALFTAGLALRASALGVLLVLPVTLAIVDRAVIAREERYLERKFGEEYRSYKSRVRRWL